MKLLNDAMDGLLWHRAVALQQLLAVAAADELHDDADPVARHEAALPLHHVRVQPDVLQQRRLILQQLAQPTPGVPLRLALRQLAGTQSAGAS